jgi:hypothetical protein
MTDNAAKAKLRDQPIDWLEADRTASIKPLAGVQQVAGHSAPGTKMQKRCCRETPARLWPRWQLVGAGNS